VCSSDLFAVPGAPEDHKLLGEFGVVWVLEEVKPPPPVPGAVPKHVFWIDLPYVAEDFVHVGLIKDSPRKSCWGICEIATILGQRVSFHCPEQTVRKAELFVR
jgi:hypothetical protein